MLMAKDWKPTWGADSPQGKQLLDNAYATLAKWGNYQGRYWNKGDGFRVDDYTNWPHTKLKPSGTIPSNFDHPDLLPTAQREGFSVHLGITEDSWPNHPQYEGPKMSEYHKEEQSENPEEHKFRVPYVWADEDGIKRVHFRHPYEVDNEMTVMDLDTWYYVNFLNGKSAPNDYARVDVGEPPEWQPLSGGGVFKHDFMEDKDAVFGGPADNLHLTTGSEHHYLIRFRNEHFGSPSAVGPVRQPNTYLTDDIDSFFGYQHLLKWVSQGLYDEGYTAGVIMERLFPNGKMPLYYWNNKVDIIELPRHAGQRIDPKLLRVEHNFEDFKFGGEFHWLVAKITLAYQGVINYVHWPRGVLQ